jgi:hypothetical protein
MNGAAAGDAAPGPGLRCAGWALALLVALDFALRAAVALRPIEATDGITTDDTFYCLHIARSIARGDGTLYGLAATNGFQPLYVFLVAPFHWIWPSDPVPPVHASLLLLAAVDALTLWAIVRWCRTIATQALVPWIVAVAWLTDAYAARTSLNGMESMVAVLCGVLALTSLDRTLRSGEARPADAARFGALVGLAGLARIDARRSRDAAGSSASLRRSAPRPPAPRRSHSSTGPGSRTRSTTPERRSR